MDTSYKSIIDYLLESVEVLSSETRRLGVVEIHLRMELLDCKAKLEKFKEYSPISYEDLKDHFFKKEELEKSMREREKPMRDLAKQDREDSLEAQRLALNKHLESVESASIRKLKQDIQDRLAANEVPQQDTSDNIEVIPCTPTDAPPRNILKPALFETLRNLHLRSDVCATLYRKRIIYLGDLVRLTDRQVKLLKGIGEGRFEAIEDFLKENNFKLGLFLPDWSDLRPKD